MSSKSTITKEAVLVLSGRESPLQAVMTVIMVLVVETLITRRFTMDLFYIPEGVSTILMVLIVAVVSIIGPVLIALIKKNGSKGKYADWEKKYTATMILDMVLTPIIGIGITSIIVQEWFADINPEAYTFIVLPLALLVTANYVLIGLNEGIKGAVEQFNKDKTDVKDAVGQLKN